jgi:hypothetical protein
LHTRWCDLLSRASRGGQRPIMTHQRACVAVEESFGTGAGIARARRSSYLYVERDASNDADNDRATITRRGNALRSEDVLVHAGGNRRNGLWSTEIRPACEAAMRTFRAGPRVALVAGMLRRRCRRGQDLHRVVGSWRASQFGEKFPIRHRCS